MTTLEQEKALAKRLVEAGLQEGMLSTEKAETALSLVDQAATFDEIDLAVERMTLASSEPVLVSGWGKDTSLVTVFSEQSWSFAEQGVPEKAVTVMGSTLLDLRAMPAGSTVRIKCTAVMGELKIWVNSETQVKNRIRPIMAEVKNQTSSQSGNTLLYLEGQAVMAEVRITNR